MEENVASRSRRKLVRPGCRGLQRDREADLGGRPSSSTASGSRLVGRPRHGRRNRRRSDSRRRGRREGRRLRPHSGTVVAGHDNAERAGVETNGSRATPRRSPSRSKLESCSRPSGSMFAPRHEIAAARPTAFFARARALASALATQGRIGTSTVPPTCRRPRRASCRRPCGAAVITSTGARRTPTSAWSSRMISSSSNSFGQQAVALYADKFGPSSRRRQALQAQGKSTAWRAARPHCSGVRHRSTADQIPGGAPRIIGTKQADATLASTGAATGRRA